MERESETVEKKTGRGRGSKRKASTYNTVSISVIFL